MRLVNVPSIISAVCARAAPDLVDICEYFKNFLLKIDANFIEWALI